jgi:hypothetical protein
MCLTPLWRVAMLSERTRQPRRDAIASSHTVGAGFACCSGASVAVSSCGATYACEFAVCYAMLFFIGALFDLTSRR